MILILTMAGSYTRFRDFSYKIPKYLLPVSNRTILHYIIKSFRETDIITDIFLIANLRDIRFRPQIEDTIKEFGIGSENLVFTEDTKGQGCTALHGLRACPADPKTAVCLHNVDTILYERDFSKIKEELTSGNVDCVIDVFKSNNKAYSYILLSQDKVISIQEKKVISDIASSGCYFFSNLKIAEEYLEKASQNNNFYISQAIGEMIKDNRKVVITDIKTERQTVVLGTPEEYILSLTSIRL
tara:strand:- start:54 stop:779 length:726 start_codon:yes stop_codon:yes gene_type:complete